jgi:hypothetical protein
MADTVRFLATMVPSFAGNEWTGNILADYRIALTARESTSPNPMITVSSNNQTIGVILDFMRHLFNWIHLRSCRYVYCIQQAGAKSKLLSAPGNRSVSA